MRILTGSGWRNKSANQNAAEIIGRSGKDSVIAKRDTKIRLPFGHGILLMTALQ